MTGVLSIPRSMTLLTEYWPYGIRQAASEPSDMEKIMTEFGFKAFQFNVDLKLRPCRLRALNDQLHEIKSTATVKMQTWSFGNLVDFQFFVMIDWKF